MQHPSRSRIAAIVRLSLKMVGGIVVLALAIVLGSFAVNFYDEPLSADAKGLLALPADHYSSGDNIYFLMAGFDAPAGQSAVETGVARVAEYNRTLEWKLSHPMDAATYITKTDPKALRFNGELCGSWPSSIWADAKNHRADIPALLTTNEELYQRYLGLHQLRGYHETARASVLAPFYFVPQPVRWLFLANFAMRIQTISTGEQRAAIDDLGRDLRTWKTIILGDGTLISKMIAAASVHRDLSVLADMIVDPNSDMALFDGEQGGILTPSALADWDIDSAIAAEFRTINSIYSQMTSSTTWLAMGDNEEPPGWWQRQGVALQSHFFKYNATENLRARQMIQLIRLAHSYPSGFSSARKEYRRWLRENETLYSPTVLFNPVGKMVVSIAATSYEDYILRPYDVAAFQRLVYLVYQIRRQGIASSEIPMFLKQHPEWANHPVDGTPFRWNPVARELTIDPVGTPPAGRRFSIAIFQQPQSN